MTAEAPAHPGPVARSEDAADRPWWQAIPTAPWWKIPLYPAAFLAAFVLVSWAGGGIPVTTLVRPLVVAIGLPLGLTALLAAILRDRDRAAVIATAATLILLTSDDRTAVVLGIVTIALVAEGLLHRGRPHWMAALATKVLSGVGLVVVVAAVIATVQDGAIPNLIDDLTEPALAPAGAVPARSMPDVYVYLLDAYPGDRAAALSSTFDREAFPAALSARGFDVVRDAHSNYLLTPLTLASMFSMRHLVDNPALDPPFGPMARDWRRLRTAIDEAEVVDRFRQAGYETIVVDSGFAHAHMARVDRFIEAPLLDELDVAMLDYTRLGSILGVVAPGFLADQARSRVEWTFETSEQLAASHGDRPRFVFVHVPAPHPPWVFEADGSPRDPDFVSVAGEPGRSTSDELDAGFAQATYIGSRTVRAVDAIRATAGPAPVIVVFSDHGPVGAFKTADPLGSAIETRASDFLAASTPGHPGLMDEVRSPINLFPALFEAYFGLHIDRQPDSIWGWRGSYLDAVQASPIPGWQP